MSMLSFISTEALIVCSSRELGRSMLPSVSLTQYCTLLLTPNSRYMFFWIRFVQGSSFTYLGEGFFYNLKHLIVTEYMIATSVILDSTGKKKIVYVMVVFEDISEHRW